MTHLNVPQGHMFLLYAQYKKLQGKGCKCLLVLPSHAKISQQKQAHNKLK